MVFQPGGDPWNKGRQFAYASRGTRRPEHERFWEKVNKDGPTPDHCPELGACWEWMGAPFKRYGSAANLKPYGFFKLNATGPVRVQVLTHRYSWELANGPIPDGMQVCHRCDNPRCVRPAHLFLGTHAHNHRDLDAKKRRRPSPGERNGNAKLTADQVARIRELAATMKVVDVARTMDLPYMRVYKAARGLRWSHVK